MKNRKGKKKHKTVIRAGTPHARFNWIMDELEKRYPDPEPFSASPPEIRFLAAMDYERVVLREAIVFAKQALDDWTRSIAPEFCDADKVAETQNRLRDVGTLYYISVVQHQLSKALHGNQNQDADR